MTTQIKPEQIRWRVGSVSKDKAKGMLLGYIDSRTAMELLDSLDGEWRDEYRIVKIGGDEGIECALTVRGVTRTDVGTPSNTEGLKGAYSDALKRAAVKHGIGRELYELPRIWVSLDGFGRPTAEPAFKNGRWVLPSGTGSVFYDHEPAQPARTVVASGATPRERLLELAHQRNLGAAALDSYAKQVGADKPATDAQIEQIIALIESQPIGAATQESEPDVVDGGSSDTTPPDEQPEVERAVAPSGVAPAADVPLASAAGDLSIQDVLAVTGGTEVVPSHGEPGYKEWFAAQPREKRQELRAQGLGPSDKPKGTPASPEPEPIAMGLTS